MDIDDLDPPEDIAGALGTVSERLALLECAIAGISAKRADIPDYSSTLAELKKAIGVIGQWVMDLRGAPVFEMAGTEWGTEIAKAATAARYDDHMLLSRATGNLDEATKQFSSAAGSARNAKRQQTWLWGAGFAGLILGTVLTVGIHFFVQSIRDAYVSHEERAAEVLSLTRLQAGERLIQVASPDLWQDLVLGDQIVLRNRGAIDRCRKFARSKVARCVVRIPPD
jgi:hypothetical protein